MFSQSCVLYDTILGNNYLTIVMINTDMIPAFEHTWRSSLHLFAERKRLSRDYIFAFESGSTDKRQIIDFSSKNFVNNMINITSFCGGSVTVMFLF